MPMKYFNVPSDAGVGGNVFSQFISSIVPTDVTSAAAAAGVNPGIPWFHVGIGPFIAASIAMQVLVAVIPSLKELTKDPVGQTQVKQYTRYMMLGVAIVQSCLTANELRPYTVLTSHYYLQVVPVLVTGAIVIAWWGLHTLRRSYVPPSCVK
jgi:preprotein translocase subunit SecY